MLPAELGDAGRAGTNWTGRFWDEGTELVLSFKRRAIFTSKTGSPIIAFTMRFTIY